VVRPNSPHGPTGRRAAPRRGDRCRGLLRFGLLGALVASGCASVPPRGELPSTRSAEWQATFDEASRYEFGASRRALSRIEDWVRTSQSSPGLRARLRRELAAWLDGSATRQAQLFACRQLAVIGAGEDVPALEPLLRDPDRADLARLALESIPGPRAAAALRRELVRSDGSLRLGLIASLGNRGDVASIGLLSRLLERTDAATASAAAAALGRIGTAAAARELAQARARAQGELKARLDVAFLECADALAAEGQRRRAAALYREAIEPGFPEPLRAAALGGLLSTQPEAAFPLLLDDLASPDPMRRARAAQIARHAPSEELGARLTRRLASLPQSGQLAVVSIISDLGERRAAPDLLRLAAESEGELRAAAIGAIGRLGGSEAIPLLRQIALSADAETASLAESSLARLQGPSVDYFLIGQLRRGASAQERALAARVLGTRQAARATRALMVAATSADATLGQAAAQALGRAARPASLPAVTELFLNQSDKDRDDALLAALLEIAQRSKGKGPALETVLSALDRTQEGSRRAGLLRIAGSIGGAAAAPALIRALDEPYGHVRLAALEALGQSEDPAPAPRLLEFARRADSAEERAAALQAYARLIGLPSERSPEQTMALLREAAGLAQSNQEMAALLEQAGSVATPAILEFIEPHLSDAALQPVATSAAVRAGALLSGARPEAVKTLMQRVLEIAQEDSTRRRARDVIASIERFEGHITAWEVSGPYGLKGKSGSSLFDVAFPPEGGESQSDPRPWRLMPAGLEAGRPWLMDLRQALGGDDQAAYLRTDVWSEIDRSATLELGSDDGVKVWLNGEMIHANNAGRGVTPGEDKVEVRLRQGWNPLMLKVVNGGGDWGACARFVGQDGRSLAGLRASPREQTASADSPAEPPVAGKAE